MLKTAREAWQNPKDDGRALETAITSHFLSEVPASQPATMDRLLSQLAPRVGYLIAKVVDDYRSGWRGDKIPVVFEEPLNEGTRVLGTSFFLWRVVSELLDNARKAWNKRYTSDEERGKHKLHIEIHVRRARQHHLRIEVRDNVPCEDREIADFFVPGGALSERKAQLERWSGLLAGEILAGGQKRMWLELRMLNLERSLRDPNDENT